MRRIINLNTIIQSSYATSNYRTRIVGTSDCNEYIPVYAISNHKLLSFKYYEIKVMEYSMPTSEIAQHNAVRTYSDLVHYLKETRSPLRYNFKIAGVAYNINIDRGIL